MKRLLAHAFSLLAIAACGGLEGEVEDSADEELATETESLEGKSYSRVALQASNGQFLVAEDGGGTKVNANRNVIGSWETFLMYELDGDRVALRAATGHWVVAEYGGGWRVLANRTSLGPWETFLRIRTIDGRIALQAYNGQYVVAEYGGGDTVYANRNAIGPWELFWVYKL